MTKAPFTLFRSTEHEGGMLPSNTALVGFRIVPKMTVADALTAYAFAQETNDLADSDPRLWPDPEWSSEQIRHAQIVLTRARHVFEEKKADDVTRLRSDGRYEVADHVDAQPFCCTADEWCILEVGHAGLCNDDREEWAGPDALYRLQDD